VCSLTCADAASSESPPAARYRVELASVQKRDSHAADGAILRAERRFILVQSPLTKKSLACQVHERASRTEPGKRAQHTRQMGAHDDIVQRRPVAGRSRGRRRALLAAARPREGLGTLSGFPSQSSARRVRSKNECTALHPPAPMCGSTAIKVIFPSYRHARNSRPFYGIQGCEDGRLPEELTERAKKNT